MLRFFLQNFKSPEKLPHSSLLPKGKVSPKAELFSHKKPLFLAKMTEKIAAYISQYFPSL
jgi:hypothetical protein